MILVELDAPNTVEFCVGTGTPSVSGWDLKRVRGGGTAVLQRGDSLRVRAKGYHPYELDLRNVLDAWPSRVVNPLPIVRVAPVEDTLF